MSLFMIKLLVSQVYINPGINTYSRFRRLLKRFKTETPMSTTDLLIKLEKELQTAASRSSRERLNSLLSDNFIEIGSSGIIRDKNQTIDLLLNSKAYDIQAMNFRLTPLSPDTMQLIYSTQEISTTQTHRKAIRSSIWKLHNTNWKIIFHQATVLAKATHSFK